MNFNLLWFVFVHCLWKFWVRDVDFSSALHFSRTYFQGTPESMRAWVFFFVFFCFPSDWFQCKLLVCLVIKIGTFVYKYQVLIYFWEKCPPKASRLGLFLADFDFVPENDHFFFHKPITQINSEPNWSCWKCCARVWEHAYGWVTWRCEKVVGKT